MTGHLPPKAAGTVSTLSPLVGRAAEAQRLTAALTRAARGRGGALFLTGEAGIGETRLAQEALAIARARSFRALSGRAYPVEGGLAYAPILDAFGPFLRHIDPARQAALVGGLPDLGRLFGGLRLPPPEPLGDPALERTRLFEAVARLLERMARDEPVALFLDDLRWADPATLELFHYVARGVADQRVLVLATCTFPQLNLARGLRPMLKSLQRAGLAEELIVSRLDAQGAAALARSLLGDEPPAMLLDLLNGRAGGTPLYIEALIRSFVDAGQLARRVGGWELRADAASALPAGVRELVLERLERLAGSHRRVLDLIAVSGDPPSHAVLLAASGLADDTLLAALDGLRSARLVAEETAGPEVVYRVTHPLVQEVAYAELSEMARRRAHAAFAQALERLRPNEPSQRPEAAQSAANGHGMGRLAHHYRGAGPEADQGRALAVLLAAGERAREVYAHDEAARHFGAALALVRAGHRPVAETAHAGPLSSLLLQRLGEAWERVGEVGAAVAAWSEALAEYERLGDRYATARLRRLLAVAEWDRGRFDSADAHLEAGLAALAGRPPSPELADLHFARATALFRLGDIAGAAAAAAELLALAGRLGSSRAAAEANIAEAEVCFARWEMPAARERAFSALAAAEAADDPLLAHRAEDRLALVAMAIGEHRLVRQHANRCLAQALRLRAPTLELPPGHRLAVADFAAGAWDEALRRSARALALARRVGQTRALAYLLVQRAMVLAYRGDLGEAEVCATEARAVLGDGARTDRNAVGSLPITEAVLALERGQTARAHAIASAFIRSTASDSTVGLPPIAVPIALALLAELQVAVGEPQNALATARDLAALSPTPSEASSSPARGDADASYPAALAARAQGLARQALGEPDAALALLAQAGEAFAALELPFECACARFEWAKVAARPGNIPRESAATAATESLATFERLGARRYARRARQLCHQLGVRPPATRRARPVGSALSARELEVARLVVDGLTAPEIAERLSISQHTATTHLRRIYARLGINSRAALARYVVEAGLLGTPN